MSGSHRPSLAGLGDAALEHFVDLSEADSSRLPSEIQRLLTGGAGISPQAFDSWGLPVTGDFGLTEFCRRSREDGFFDELVRKQPAGTRIDHAEQLILDTGVLLSAIAQREGLTAHPSQWETLYAFLRQMLGGMSWFPSRTAQEELQLQALQMRVLGGSLGDGSLVADLLDYATQLPGQPIAGGRKSVNIDMGGVLCNFHFRDKEIPNIADCTQKRGLCDAMCELISVVVDEEGCGSPLGLCVVNSDGNGCDCICTFYCYSWTRIILLIIILALVILIGTSAWGAIREWIRRHPEIWQKIWEIIKRLLEGWLGPDAPPLPYPGIALVLSFGPPVRSSDAADPGQTVQALVSEVLRRRTALQQSMEENSRVPGAGPEDVGFMETVPVRRSVLHREIGSGFATCDRVGSTETEVQGRAGSCCSSQPWSSQFAARTAPTRAFDSRRKLSSEAGVFSMRPTLSYSQGRRLSRIETSGDDN